MPEVVQPITTPRRSAPQRSIALRIGSSSGSSSAASSRLLRLSQAASASGKGGGSAARLPTATSSPLSRARRSPRPQRPASNGSRCAEKLIASGEISEIAWIVGPRLMQPAPPG